MKNHTKTNPFTEHTLSNGLRIVIEQMDGVRSAAAGFLARTGGRDEPRQAAGVSHFLEHMCFKGTPKRTWEQINVAFDEMGSYYNAYTSKEKTFYFGWVRKTDADRQIELLADMMRSTLPESEFQTERNVILEEIAMSNDQIQNVAYDFAHEKVFGDHALGLPVLGHDEVIADLPYETMAEYFRARYAPDNLVLIVAGNVDPDAVIQSGERYCGDWKPANCDRNEYPPKFLAGTSVRQIERFNQQLLVEIFGAPSVTDAFSETAEAVAAILGGDNSRFYWNICQAGLSPHAGAGRIDYRDCGLILLSAQAEPENCEKLLDAMRREARLISEQPVEDREVQRVKNKRRTALAVEAESPYHRLTQIADDVDYYGSPRTVERRLADVDAVSVKSVADYLRRWPITGNGHLISVGPRNWPES